MNRWMIATVILSVACVALTGTSVAFYSELQTATKTQNGGLTYIGSITNFSENYNLTYGSITVNYVSAGSEGGGVALYSNDTSVRVLMVVHYRGFINTIVLTPYQAGTFTTAVGGQEYIAWSETNIGPYNNEYEALVPSGTTELDFYILTN